MISTFYNARSGAIAQNEAMQVISNNLANMNTAAFKDEKMNFSDLLYTNMKAPAGQIDPQRSGNGVKSQQVGVLLEPGGLQNTGMTLDFAIQGRGFFAVADPNSGAISYTRDGSFRWMLSDSGSYLADSSGNYVLDDAQAPIIADEEVMQKPTQDGLQIGIFDFTNQYGLLKTGNNRYVETTQSGAAEAIVDHDLKQGYLENSNVDAATEMVRVIETQRAFQFNARLVQVADELDQTINNLR